MPVQFNPNALDAFRNAQFANANSIANLNDQGGVKANGEYKGGIRVLFRSDDERAANNAVRTELLKSLGKAFGLAGMQEAGGKVTFSKDFMDKLESLLGAAFKRDDFKIAADGTVSSGKPLTSRRITAILTKAAVVGKSTFDIGIYRTKLNAIKEELGIAGLSAKDLDKAVEKNGALKMFVHAEKALDFLENDIFMGQRVPDPDYPGETTMVYGPKKETTDKSVIRNNPEYMFTKSLNANDPALKHMVKFQIRSDKEKGYVDLKNTAGFQNGYLWHSLGGELLHLERAKFSMLNTDCDDIEPLKKYIHDTVQLFAMKMVDCYFEAKELGKLDEFMEFLQNPGACLEDKGLHLVQFENRIAPKEDLKPMDSAKARELERIADQNLDSNAPPPKADRMVFDELDDIFAKPEFADKDEWKDVAELVKKRLVGKTSGVMVPVTKDNGRVEFKPLLDKQGQPVVRPLTAEDIDKLGEPCVKLTLGLL